MNLYTAKEIATNFVEENYPECSGAILSGSFARGTNNDNSDIDIVVLSKIINTSSTAKIRNYNGHDIDVTVLAENKIVQDLIEDLTSLNGTLFVLLDDGIIIKDRNNKIEHLIDFARSSLIKYYPSLSKEVVENMRVLITNLIEDLKSGALDFSEKYFSVTHIIDLVTKLNLSYHFKFFGRGKQRIKALNKCVPGLSNDIAIGLKDFYNNGSVEYFINVVSGNLKLFGGEIKEYSSRNTFSSLQNNSFLVELKKERNIFLTLLKKYPSLLNHLNQLEIKIKFFYADQDKLFIVLEKKSTTISHSSLKLFFHKFFALPILSRNNLIVKENKSPLFLSEPQVVKVIEDEIESFHSVIKNHTSFLSLAFENKSVRIALGIILWKEFLQGVDMSTDDQKDFCEKLFNFWFPALYDLDLNCNYELIQLKREKMAGEIGQFILSNSTILNQYIDEDPTLPEHQGLNALLTDLKYYFIGSFKHFTLQLNALIDTGLELPHFMKMVFTFENTQDGNKWAMYELFLNKIYTMVGINEYAVIPFIFMKHFESHNGLSTKGTLKNETTE